MSGRAKLRGMQKTTVGSIEITALVDLVQSYPATTVYPGVGDTARFARHLDADGNVPLGFASFLVRDLETLLLVDTGWGPEHGGQLISELSAAGVKPPDVTHVLFTHLHGDHTGWNIDRETGRPIFANARYLAPKADWDHFDAQDRGESERLAGTAAARVVQPRYAAAAGGGRARPHLGRVAPFEGIGGDSDPRAHAGAHECGDHLRG